jgi:hypothetical protein
LRGLRRRRRVRVRVLWLCEGLLEGLHRGGHGRRGNITTVRK